MAAPARPEALTPRPPSPPGLLRNAPYRQKAMDGDIVIGDAVAQLNKLQVRCTASTAPQGRVACMHA